MTGSSFAMRPRTGPTSKNEFCEWPNPTCLIHTRSDITFGTFMSESNLPDWEQLLSAAAHLQSAPTSLDSHECRLNPICLPDEGVFSVSFLSSSNTTRKYLSCVESFLMTATNLRFSSSFVSSISRSRTKARMMAMFTSIACSLFSTLDSIATPCSVKAYGK